MASTDDQGQKGLEEVMVLTVPMVNADHQESKELKVIWAKWEPQVSMESMVRPVKWVLLVMMVPTVHLVHVVILANLDVRASKVFLVCPVTYP